MGAAMEQNIEEKTELFDLAMPQHELCTEIAQMCKHLNDFSRGAIHFLMAALVRKPRDDGMNQPEELPAIQSAYY